MILLLQHIKIDCVYTFVLNDDPLHDFVVSEEFTTDQANMFDLQLYRIDGPILGLWAEVMNGLAGNAKGWLTANATAVGGVVSSNGTSVTSTGLSPGTYIYLISFDADGTPNNDPDEEKCYTISRTIIVSQRGCTDPNAANYNTDYDTIPNFFLPSEGCLPPQDRDCTDPGFVFNLEANCANEGTFGHIKLTIPNFLEDNPELLDAQLNGFTNTQETINQAWTAAGEFVPPSVIPETLSKYIFYEVFCFDVYNSDTPYDASFEYQMSNNLPSSTAMGGTWSNGFAGPPNGTGYATHVIRVMITHTLADGTTIQANPGNIWYVAKFVYVYL